jgi:hypothetical protein
VSDIPAIASADGVRTAATDRRQKRKVGGPRVAALRARLPYRCVEREANMPDQTEILLQEVAILRGEVAYLHTMLEKSDESVRNLSVTLLERLNTLVLLMQKIEARLPILPQ